ncbi:MAG: adenylate/guanylate cyclase domain-containing protein [Chromatocurvus sp.]
MEHEEQESTLQSAPQPPTDAATVYPWREALLRAIGELLDIAAPAGLTTTACEDFKSLRKAAEDMAGMLADTAAQSRHDVRNQLSALRGYGEMLAEQLPAGSAAALSAALQRLLLATRSAEDPTSPDLESGAGITIAGEPGFILAVDDRLENRELVARYLSRCGHSVVTAASGEEALVILGQADVDVVLLDLLMPNMDGHEVLQLIKEHPDWHATPVIVISGHQDMQGIIRCIEAGADDYLFKPFNPVLLQARIKAGIERKRWHDREEQYRQQLERNEQFIRATFGRYLSDEIVTDILERPEGLDLGGKLREVTILMSDIRGFTTLCEQLEPTEVVRMLNRYLGAMTDIILSYQGTIDEFIGDAILAVFGAPQHREDDADRAVQCALAMQAAHDALNRENAREGFPALHTGIALNTGQVIAGNIGSERRSKYGFVGHAMNVTARIEDVTRGGDVVIADATLQKLQGRYRVDDSREIRAPGMDDPLHIHRVLGALP